MVLVAKISYDSLLQYLFLFSYFVFYDIIKPTTTLQIPRPKGKKEEKGWYTKASYRLPSPKRHRSQRLLPFTPH